MRIRRAVKGGDLRTCAGILAASPEEQHNLRLGRRRRPDPHMTALGGVYRMRTLIGGVTLSRAPRPGGAEMNARDALSLGEVLRDAARRGADAHGIPTATGPPTRPS